MNILNYFHIYGVQHSRNRIITTVSGQPDKMPPTVEFVFSFLQMLFQFVVASLNEAANCVKRRKIELNIIARFYSKYKNTNTLFTETPTRVKQLNEFNAVCCRTV